MGKRWAESRTVGRLTAKKVESLTAPGRYSDDDGSGFHVRVTPDGGKYYILRVHDSGKRRDISLGSAKRITLGVAREKARKKLEQLGADGKISDDIPTFAEAAKQAHATRTSGYKNAKHVAQWLSTLETYAFPHFGEKPVSEVNRSDVITALEPIWLSKVETADRTLQRIDRVIRWAVGHEHRKEPIDVSLVRGALPRRDKKRLVKRMKAVPWQDVPAFWAAIPMSASAPLIRAGLSLLILTASRPGNIALAKREQFDLDAAVWTIPAQEMKGGVEHRVPLSTQAVDLVRAVMDGHAHQLLFAVGKKPISPDTLRMMMRGMKRDETPHGFRSSFKDWSRSAGWADYLSEAALAHVDPNEVRAAYARSDLLEERRPMMQAWALFVAGSPGTPGETPPG